MNWINSIYLRGVLNPRGVYVETIVIFMFHHSFMTKVDQAVRIQCFYMEAEKTVDVPLEVSMITTEFRTNVYPMPTCFYSLRSGSPDGPEISFATIGEKIYHRWECIENSPWVSHGIESLESRQVGDSSRVHPPLDRLRDIGVPALRSEAEGYDIFGMLVHDCWVDDGLGDTVFLIDDNGCGIDKHLLGTPEYEGSLRVASKESHIFKYADRPLLDFQCQITVCYKDDGGCNGITPPVCSSSSRRKRRSIEGPTLDVIAGSVSVLDMDPQRDSALESRSVEKGRGRSSQNETCIGHVTLILIVGFVVLSYFVVIVSVGVCVFRRKRE